MQPIVPVRLAQQDAAVLASEEGRARGDVPIVPNGHAHMDGDAHAADVGMQNGLAGQDGLAHSGALVLATDPEQAAIQHRMMLGHHKFGERTHGGVQSRHYHAVKIVGAFAEPVVTPRGLLWLLTMQSCSAPTWGIAPC